MFLELRLGRYSLNLDANSSKAEWRFWARGLRSSLPDASEAIWCNLETFLRALEPRTVLAYRAFRDEVRLEALAETAPEIAWLTTRVHPDARLTLHAFSSATVTNRFGILEPHPDAPEFDPRAVDVALVPGLAFDLHGTRLGYGAGFYDRLLPRLRPGIPIIGATRDALIVPELPREPHDVRMTHLVTESGVRAV